MRLSKFQELLGDEFGAAFSQVVLRDTRVTQLGDQTPAEALAEGVDPATVWLAVCEHHQVPKARWHGRPQLKPEASKSQLG
jgi:hypothetical protein